MNLIPLLAKQLPHPLLCRLYHHQRLRAEYARAAEAADIAGLPLLSSIDLRSYKQSETLFVLGSAWSVNYISESKWKIIAKHDSVGLNFWPIHPFVPRFYHVESVSSIDHPALYRALQMVLERRARDYIHTLKIISEIVPLDHTQTVTSLPEDMKKKMYVSFSMPVVARSEEELRYGIRYMQSLGTFSESTRIEWLFKYGGSAIAMLALAVRMGYKRIVLCGVDLNRQDYFYQHAERYPEFARWEFASKQENHKTTRRLPWLVPAQTAVVLFKELILDPLMVKLFVENRVSSLYPQVPLAPESLFKELAQKPGQDRASVSSVLQAD